MTNSTKWMAGLLAAAALLLSPVAAHARHGADDLLPQLPKPEKPEKPERPEKPGFVA